MITREEMLKGIVKVNDERIDPKNVEQSRGDAAAGTGGGGIVAASGEPIAATTPAKASIAHSEESLEQFVARRADELIQQLSDLDADIEDASGRLRTLGEKKQRLNAELEQLRRIAQDG